MEVHVREFSKLEEIFEKRYGDVFVTVLYFGLVHELKNKLKTIETRGIDVHDIHKSYFHHFCPDQTLNFPYFVTWCATKHSQSKRVIMESIQ